MTITEERDGQSSAQAQYENVETPKHRRVRPSVAYYLGRPAQVWIDALRPKDHHYREVAQASVLGSEVSVPAPTPATDPRGLGDEDDRGVMVMEGSGNGKTRSGD